MTTTDEMAALQDVRTKVSEEAHCALRARCRVTGKDISELCREIIEAWAEAEIRNATLLRAYLNSEGGQGKGGE